MRYAIAMVVTAAVLGAADRAPVLTKKVDPDQSISHVGVVFDQAEVQLTIDPSGVPFSLQSSMGLPDYVVTALEQWRYSPFVKNGHQVAFTVRLLAPIARPLTPALERSFAPVWRAADADQDVRDAIKAGRELDKAGAEALAAKLTQVEAVGNPRTSLLVYYSTKGSDDVEKALKMRAELLTWLVENYPEDAILGSHYALVNSAGEPLADPETSTALANLWVKTVNDRAGNEMIAGHALNFLQVASPHAALALRKSLLNWKASSSWGGDIYGYATLGVTALSPATGRAVSASGAAESAAFRELAVKLLASDADTKMVLSGFTTMKRAATSLTREGNLPGDFNRVCSDLLAHVKQLYPGTTQSCDIVPPAENQPTPGARSSGKLVEASLLHKVEPSYPSEAKAKRVQGTVQFVTVIDASGTISSLELKEGPFLLYPAARAAVSQWRYKPLTIDGKPSTFTTTVVVNFAMGR